MKITHALKTMIPLAAFAAVGLLLLSNPANAAVISIDFGANQGTASGDTVAAPAAGSPLNAQGQSFTGQVGNWNVGPLVNHIGAGPFAPINYVTSEGPVFTINPTGSAQMPIETFSSAGTIRDPLRDDWYNLNSARGTDRYNGPVPWALTGLTPNGTYDITFFSDRSFRGGETAITGVGIGALDAEGDADFAGVVADGSGEITGTWDIINTGAWYAWSGLQFEDVTPPAAIPEPSSTALLGLGGLALILRRRK